MSCQELIKQHDLPNHCCNSCHDDADEGYYNGEMLSVDNPDGTETECCCAVYNAYNDKYGIKP